MNTFYKAATLAATSLLAASMAVATTVDFLAMDNDNIGDDVMFSVTNNGSQSISMITFDVSMASDVSDMARFNTPMGTEVVLDGRSSGVSESSTTVEFIDTNADAGFEQLKFSFAADDFAQGDTLVFDSWIQYLNDMTAAGQKGGLDDAGARLFATVVLEDGTTASSFFDFAANDKATLELDFVAAVPLPASSLLLLGGLAGLAAAGRRKKKA